MSFIHSVNGDGPKTAKINSTDKLQVLIFINIKNCSLSVMLTATYQKPQKPFKGNMIHHQIA